jgi:hypothetical protein
VVDQKVPVLPMVPGGNALHDMIVYDEGELFRGSGGFESNREQRRRRSGEPH